MPAQAGENSENYPKCRRDDQVIKVDAGRMLEYRVEVYVFQQNPNDYNRGCGFDGKTDHSGSFPT
jgi:hypothetical protein